MTLDFVNYIIKSTCTSAGQIAVNKSHKGVVNKYDQGGGGGGGKGDLDGI